MTTKTGRVYGSQVRPGDVWIREADVRIPIRTTKVMANGNVLVNGLWAFCSIDLYRIERTY